MNNGIVDSKAALRTLKLGTTQHLVFRHEAVHMGKTYPQYFTVCGLEVYPGNHLGDNWGGDNMLDGTPVCGNCLAVANSGENDRHGAEPGLWAQLVKQTAEDTLRKLGTIEYDDPDNVILPPSSDPPGKGRGMALIMPETRVKGMDVSVYNLDINAQAAKDGGITYVYIRGVVGLAARDKQYDANWRKFKEVQIHRGVYFVPVWSLDADAQLRNWKSLYPNGYDGELPIALDLERVDGTTPANAQAMTLKMAKDLASWSGHEVILYSNANWTGLYMTGATWLGKYRWWIASYLNSGYEMPHPPVMPKMIGSYLIHQTTGHGPGPQYGMSGDLDLDRLSPV